MRNVIASILLIILVSACTAGLPLRGTNVRLYKGEAFRLAKAVRDERVGAIERIIKKEPLLLDFKEPTYGMPILSWAISREKLRSVQALLQLGADPNVLETYSGESALIVAAANEESSEYVAVMLRHGASPNILSNSTPQTMYYTPLIAAVYNRLESVRLLIDNGADPNYVHINGVSALREAFTHARVDAASYLLLEKNVNFSNPLMKTIDGKYLFAVDLLRSWRFDLASDEYQKKLVIINFLKERGQDYWSTPIPAHFYKIHTREYLDRY